jgi:hypothetical protein
MWSLGAMFAGMVSFKHFDLSKLDCNISSIRRCKTVICSVYGCGQSELILVFSDVRGILDIA